MISAPAMTFHELADEAQTRALGAELARVCPPGSVVLLRGPLGAGKTTLADGFIAALGGKRATSPTFTIAHRHDDARVPLWHLDLYRITDQAAVDDLDLAQYLPQDGIAVVEWPERAGDVWPDDRIDVTLTIVGPARRATITAFGRCAEIG
ncbi:MAG TPA: tRNA (adenosine(37)-N6)-threonylcarbamoyltransferase complex ATPase subunit type 1 TsaE [Candidatus Eremiobacteraceae bacterium]|nr:tRNA (adenosine(37)-N6)-threonylcarbamoyltransferase complex ATPase subunit type 1 TsaE [Candidatus Eremiobacteraceae bacterium]